MPGATRSNFDRMVRGEISNHNETRDDDQLDINDDHGILQSSSRNSLVP